VLTLIQSTYHKGGKHAGGDLQVQEFMIVPKAGNSFAENLRIVATVYHHLSKILVKAEGVSAKNLGDEGGFAPPLKNPHQALSYIESAIVAAGFRVGEDVFLALDCAASEFYQDGKYEVEKKNVLEHKRVNRVLLEIEEGSPESRVH